MSEIKLLFCGDFIPSGAYEPIIMQKKENVFGDALPLIKSSDFSFVNLETPLTLHSTYLKKSGPSLKSNPDFSKILKLFSLVGLANNHILDFGRKGLEDTLTACTNHGVSTVGAALNLKEETQTYVANIKGIKIGILAIAEQQFNKPKDEKFGSVLMDPIDNYHHIEDLKLKSDFIFVTIHGGIQNFSYPSPRMRKLCKFYVDLGANAVICHHPHVPGAYEYYKGNPIIYSLGDLINHHQNPNKTNNYGYIAQFNIETDNKKQISFTPIPYKQSVKFEGIKLLKEKEKEQFLSMLDKYFKVIQNENLWLSEWTKLVKEREESFILRLFMPITFKGLGILTKYTPILKMLLIKKSIPKKLNIIRSQSYLEILTHILESKINK